MPVSYAKPKPWQSNTGLDISAVDVTVAVSGLVVVASQLWNQ